MASLINKAITGGRERPFASAPGMELSDWSSESVIVRNADGIIQYWNAASEALYGWPAMAMIGQNFAAFCASGPDEARMLRSPYDVLSKSNSAGG
ncbi:PAS domain S-box-containing protein [Bradyrhizobium sp. AZCC 1719]|uniref:PAS domain-containing protein n=1 Tax=Bradyrhizobium sp. AZCC 1719 TaxID=3117028 RepID=UPI002FF37D48